MRSTDPTILWDTLRQGLSKQLPEASFKEWIAPCAPLEVKGGTLWIQVPSAAAKLWIEQQLPEEFSDALAMGGLGDLRLEFRVNGTPVAFNGDAFYTCFTFRAQDVSSLLQTGRNAIILALNHVSALPASLDAHARYGSEIESIYLIGDFAVRAVAAEHPLATTYRNEGGSLTPKPVNSFQRFVIGREQEAFSGDLAQQGYPFYAGEFQLETSLTCGALFLKRVWMSQLPKATSMPSSRGRAARACRRRPCS